jgi:predicted RNA-binding protein
MPSKPDGGRSRSGDPPVGPEESEMCDANAYLLREGAEEMLLESVDLVETEGDEVTLVNIFGERKIVRARLKLFDNGQGKLLFEPA